MSLDTKNAIALGKALAKADPSSPAVAYSYGDKKFSYDELNETFRQEMNALAGTYALYRENKNTIFTILEEIIEDVLPKKVMDQYGQFAETKTFKQGDKPVFVQKITVAAKRRALQFITKVGLAGIYEVFKLDGKSYEVQTSAFGGATQIGFEEFLDGRVNFADVLNIVMEGLDRAIYIEIERALKSSVSQLPSANIGSETGFNEKEFDRLLGIADSYGVTSTIYCTFEFASTMIPAEGWVSDAMKDTKWNNGYLGNYKGHRVVVLQQSYEDETNEKKVIDPSYAWIIPAGANDKPVKIAFEGATIIDEYVNKDRSREIQIYKKVGVGALMTNNICVYQNTDLAFDDSILVRP